MSVDDVIDSATGLLERKGVAENTYFIYSSDHGFQLGEFNLLIDKRQMYVHCSRESCECCVRCVLLFARYGSESQLGCSVCVSSAIAVVVIVLSSAVLGGGRFLMLPIDHYEFSTLTVSPDVDFMVPSADV